MKCQTNLSSHAVRTRLCLWQNPEARFHFSRRKWALWCQTTAALLLWKSLQDCEDCALHACVVTAHMLLESQQVSLSSLWSLMPVNPACPVLLNLPSLMSFNSQNKGFSCPSSSPFSSIWVLLCTSSLAWTLGQNVLVLASVFGFRTRPVPPAGGVYICWTSSNL